jgi:hypothetical protein
LDAHWAGEFGTFKAEADRRYGAILGAMELPRRNVVPDRAERMERVQRMGREEAAQREEVTA